MTLLFGFWYLVINIILLIFCKVRESSFDRALKESSDESMNARKKYLIDLREFNPNAKLSDEEEKIVDMHAQNLNRIYSSNGGMNLGVYNTHLRKSIRVWMMGKTIYGEVDIPPYYKKYLYYNTKLRINAAKYVYNNILKVAGVNEKILCYIGGNGEIIDMTFESMCMGKYHNLNDNVFYVQ